MGKMKEKELEEQEKVAESEVIEAPENITGDVPAENEQGEQTVNPEQTEEHPEANAEEKAEQEEEPEEDESNEPVASIDVPDDITGDAPVEDKQEETAEVKYKAKAKACIYYGNKKIMPGEILVSVEANTIHSLLKNGFVELI